MKHPHLLAGEGKVTPQNLELALQQAIEIEIATIPVYLYTYYSVNRTPDQDSITNTLKQAFLAKGMTEQEAATKALNLSARIMVVANKAGAAIISVVIEEMLHMSLSSNVKQALFGNPELVGKSPEIWPAYLAGHEPPFPINRAKLSRDQLYTFLEIESPKPLGRDVVKSTAIEYVTIGEFYDQIEKCISADFADDSCYDVERPQLVPGRGYYAQNDIDTVFYNKQHKPKFENADDSGDLVHVVDKDSALKALQTIVEQGEGHQSSRGLEPGGGVCCKPFTAADYDDPKGEELAHFDKFNQLWCMLKHLEEEFEREFDGEIDPKSLFIYDLPLNPSVSDYPDAIQKVAVLTNAVYSYLYVMTQACYRADKNTQYEIFMFGIHKSMMWILGSLCGELPGMTYVGSDGKQYNAAPTFEEYSFSAASSPKSQIIELFETAVAAAPGIAYMKQRVYDLPNVPLEGYLQQSGQSLMS